MGFRRSLSVAIVTACIAGPAFGQVNVYYHAGAWDAFDGPGDNGLPICGIGNRGPDGRTFSLRFQIGGDKVTFTAAKPGWNIPDGTQMPVVMQIGPERPWQEQAQGSGQRMEWTLSSVDMPAFDAEFRRASSMTVTFPAGNEPSWIIPLHGSTAISNAMGRCVRDMARRAPVATSPAPSAPAPQGATQPFSAAPGGQGSPAPTQPEPQGGQTQPNAPH